MNFNSKFNIFLLCSASILNSCGGGSSAVVSSNPLPDTLYPEKIIDINPDPKIVEVNLVAQQSLTDYGDIKNVIVYSYNGIVPGPIIEANVGDEIIVHFKNELSETTTVHWHGVELPADMDGSDISQTPVVSGGEFTYNFTVHRAATYWYHPHVRSNVQVELGLHGALIVRDPVKDKELQLPINEHVLLLDDVLINELNQVAKAESAVPILNLENFFNGRTGNVLLVNGKVNPKIRLKRGVPNRLRLINVSNARFMRISVFGHDLWRIGGDAGLIAKSERHLPIRTIANSKRQESKIEFISDQDPTKGILLTPGERAEIIFTPISDESELTLMWHDINRGKHKVTVEQVPIEGPIPPGGHTHTGILKVGRDILDGFMPPEPLVTFKLYGDNNITFYNPPPDLVPVTKIDESLVTGEPIKITYGHTIPKKVDDLTKFFIKMKMNPDYDLVTNPDVPKMIGVPYDQVTKEFADKVNPNQTKIIEITNMTLGDHNFHLHGFMFQLLDTQFIDDSLNIQEPRINAPITEFKDTIIIPGRPGAFGSSKSITRLLVKFDDLNRENQIFAEGKLPIIDVASGKNKSGGWIMHCHFLEHSAKGMMSFIQVIP